jgi:hypothetical protein
MTNHAEMRARWEAAREKLLAEIASIDKDTDWSEVEPGWWLQMMEVQRAARSTRPT